MSGMIKTVLSLSLSGSLLILVLLLMKPLVRDRLSKGWQYYIWLVVLARLLLPFAPEESLMETAFSPEKIPIQVEIGPVSSTVVLPMPSEEKKPVDNPSIQGEKSPVPAEPETAAVDWGLVLFLIWLGTALLLLVRKITAYQSFVRYLKAGCAEVMDLAYLDRLAQAEEAVGVRRPVELYINPLAASPMLLGVLRPCIVLPGLGLSEEDFQYTVLHELIHCKRMDLCYKWLVQLTVCLHWFNPLVWRMGREIDRACELACDEAVLRTLDDPGRRAYGTVLLRTAEAAGDFRTKVAAVTLHEGAELLKERLEAIMKFKKGSKRTVVLSLLLTAALVGTGMAAGAYSGPTKDLARPAPALTGLRETLDTVKGWRKDSPQKTEDNLSQQAKRDALEAELDRQRREEYAAHEITQDGKNYYYQGELVHIFLDRQQNRTVYYTLEINPSGTVNLKITRDGDGKIQQVETMTQAQAEALLREMEIGPYAQDDDDLDGWDWDWEEDDKKKAEQEQRVHPVLGVTTDGEDYYYQGTLVRIYMDQKPNGAFYVLEINPAGTVDLKTVRDENGRFLRVERMTQAEAEALLRDMEDE